LGRCALFFAPLNPPEVGTLNFFQIEGVGLKHKGAKGNKGFHKEMARKCANTQGDNADF
jgi:hypothetical protein